METAIDKLEATIWRGNVDNVVDAGCCTAGDIELSFERAAAIDLAGRNVLEAVQMSVNQGDRNPVISAVAKNGVN